MTFLVIALGVFALMILGVAASKRQCPHCREQIDRGASVCPKCQREIVVDEMDKARHKSKVGNIAAGVIISCIVLIALIAFTGRDTENNKQSKPFTTKSALSGMSDQEVNSTFALFQQQQFVKRIDAIVDEVYVDKPVWDLMPAHGKEQAAALIAEYLARQDKDENPDVTIKDYMSGKQLAKYSSVFGFKVY